MSSSLAGAAARALSGSGWQTRGTSRTVALLNPDCSCSFPTDFWLLLARVGFGEQLVQVRLSSLARFILGGEGLRPSGGRQGGNKQVPSEL